MGFCQGGVLSDGVLSDGVLSGWGFVLDKLYNILNLLHLH